jgi:hypothetical protein
LTLAALNSHMGRAQSYEHESGIEITPDTYTMTTPCTAEFKAQAVQLLQYPDALFDVVSADYATRWPDLTPPTLEDCEAFCAAVVVQVASNTAYMPDLP